MKQASGGGAGHHGDTGQVKEHYFRPGLGPRRQRRTGDASQHERLRTRSVEKET